MEIPSALRDRYRCVLCQRTWAQIADMCPDRKACGHPIDVEHNLAICFECEEQCNDLLDRRISGNKTHYFDKLQPELSTSCAFCGTLNSQDRTLYKLVSSVEPETVQFLGTTSTGVAREICKQCVIEIMQLTYTLLANSNYESDQRYAREELAKINSWRASQIQPATHHDQDPTWHQSHLDILAQIEVRNYCQECGKPAQAGERELAVEAESHFAICFNCLAYDAENLPRLEDNAYKRRRKDSEDKRPFTHCYICASEKHETVKFEYIKPGSSTHDIVWVCIPCLKELIDRVKDCELYKRILHPPESNRKLQLHQLQLDRATEQPALGLSCVLCRQPFREGDYQFPTRGTSFMCLDCYHDATDLFAEKPNGPTGKGRFTEVDFNPQIDLELQRCKNGCYNYAGNQGVPVFLGPTGKLICKDCIRLFIEGVLVEMTESAANAEIKYQIEDVLAQVRVSKPGAGSSP